MELADWIQSFVLLVTIIGLIISILNNRKQVKAFNEQLKLNFFSTFTSRYQEIILNFPEEINEPDFDYNKLQTEDRSKVLRYMRAYFNLCSEEFDLWKAGKIEERIWENWKEGIEFSFSKVAFRNAWKLIKFDSYYYSDFSTWINNLIVKNENMNDVSLRDNN